MTIRFTLILLMLLVAKPALAVDTDVVEFANGDRLTGEIKSLERGKLRFKTPATNTIEIEWDKVAYLSSRQNIQVETQEGLRFLGGLQRAEDPQRLAITTSQRVVEVDAMRVVLMTPIEDQRTEQLDIDMTAGYNFAQAAETQQLRLGMEVDFRNEDRHVSLSASSINVDNSDSNSSQRHNIALDYRRLLDNRWYTAGNIDLTSNDELNLDLRRSIGLGGGRYLLQSNNMLLAVGGSLQYSKEQLISGTSDQDTIEGVFNVDWDWFRYDTPELDFSTSLNVFPNLSEWGRVRAEFDLRMKWEIVEDLFWDFRYYESYDSDPAVNGASNTDRGVNTSLGWEF